MLELKEVTLLDEYRKKWNVHKDEKVYHLYKDGEKVNDNIYNFNGFYNSNGYNKNLNKNKYSMVTKRIESMYEDHITEDEDKKPYLARHWCIINNEGKEMKVFDEFVSPYLCGGVIYCVDNYYYNIETNQLYCRSSSKMETPDHLFLHDEFNEDRSKRGVMMIVKKNGVHILFN